MILTEMDKTLQEQSKMIGNLLSSKKVQRKLRLAKRRQAGESQPLNLVKDTASATPTTTSSTITPVPPTVQMPMSPPTLGIKTERDEDLDSIEEIEVIPPPPPSKKSRMEGNVHHSSSAGSFGQAISLKSPTRVPSIATNSTIPNFSCANNTSYPSILWPTTITKKDVFSNGEPERRQSSSPKQPLKRPAKVLLPAPGPGPMTNVALVTPLEQGGIPPFTMKILLPPAEQQKIIKVNPTGVAPEGDLTDETIVNLPKEVIAQKVQLEIVEQPACNRIRFRYECEGRSQSLQGKSTSHETRTYPSIRINGYKGRYARLIVSCVEEKSPYRCHPHNLVGRRCDRGVCKINVAPDGSHPDNADMSILFKDLGVQCVKKRDTVSSLEARKAIGIDPFKQGFQHMHKGPVNLNALRLCFQTSLLIPGREPIHLEPVVSDVIRDKKAYNELNIVDCSDNWSPVNGGKKILLFTKKISKTDIEVHFSFTNGIVMKGSFAQNDVHEQCGIALVTPPFPNQLIKDKVCGQMYLYRPSENLQSDPIDFTYYPIDQDPFSSIQTTAAEIRVNEISDEELDSRSKSSSPIRPAPALMQQSSIVEDIIDNCLSIVETEEEEDEIEDDDPEERPLEIVDEDQEEEIPQPQLKHPLKVRAIEELMKTSDDDEKSSLAEPDVRDGALVRYFTLMEDLGVPELTMVLEMAANMIRKKVTK